MVGVQRGGSGGGREGEVVEVEGEVLGEDGRGAARIYM